jgi:4-amino-4-deoxy-L-arabinose transferase-like glycosyltransferase
MSVLTSLPIRFTPPPAGPTPRTSVSYRRRFVPIVCVLLLCGGLFFYGLNAGELYQTESLRAIVAAEMLRSGNWIVPSLYGEPLLTKPPGMYAAIAAASWPFGRVTAVSARLPSSLAASLVVFLFYGVFARRLGWRAGLLAAVLLPASVSWLQRAPSAEIDMVQLAWVSASLLCFLRALEIAESQPRRSFVREWPWWQLALLCVAGGVLTKWTAAAFFYLTVVPLLWRRGQLHLLWSRAHLCSALMGALPCLGWIAAVAAQTGWTPFLDAVRGEALPRLSPAHHARPYPWGELVTFPFVFIAANLPWSAAALWTLSPRFRSLWDERSRRLLQLFHCWTWPNLLFWTIVPGHHARHALPLQPGLIGLSALVWIAWIEGRLRWPVPRVQPRRLFAGFVLLWLVVKVVFVTTIVPLRDRDRAPKRKGEQIAALVPVAETLYLFRLKDEGILFYYGRAARRLSPAFMQMADWGDRYCLLTEAEYRQVRDARRIDILQLLNDEQGHVIVLAKVS